MIMIKNKNRVQSLEEPLPSVPSHFVDYVFQLTVEVFFFFFLFSCDFVFKIAELD